MLSEVFCEMGRIRDFELVLPAGGVRECVTRELKWAVEMERLEGGVNNLPAQMLVISSPWTPTQYEE